VKKRDRSRDAIRARVMPTPSARTIAASDRRQTFPVVVAGFISIVAAHGCIARCHREER
jgi:hypothetical protein